MQGSDCGWPRGLPRKATELRGDLLRRLELLEREVSALVGSGNSGASAESVATLRALEQELRSRLAEDLEPAAWAEQRTEIIELWRRHRRDFERLVDQCQQKVPARPGSSRRGPRW